MKKIIILAILMFSLSSCFAPFRIGSHRHHHPRAIHKPRVVVVDGNKHNHHHHRDRNDK